MNNETKFIVSVSFRHRDCDGIMSGDQLKEASLTETELVVELGQLLLLYGNATRSVVDYGFESKVVEIDFATKTDEGYSSHSVEYYEE